MSFVVTSFLISSQNHLVAVLDQGEHHIQKAAVGGRAAQPHNYLRYIGIEGAKKRFLLPTLGLELLGDRILKQVGIRDERLPYPLGVYLTGDRS